MIVIVSWYSDGSGRPVVRFHNANPLANNSTKAIGELIATIRDSADKECYAYKVTSEDFELVYDSTSPEKERKQ